MKNLFTVNTKTKEHGFDEFLLRRSDSALKTQFDENDKLFNGALKKRFNPLVYTSLALLFCGAICLAIFLEILEDAESFAQAYSTFGWALYVGIIGILQFAILIFIAIIWMRKFMANPQTQNLLQEQDELKRKIARSLRVPEGCAGIDVLCLPYKISRGRQKYKAKNYFENLPMWVFVDNGNLYLADTFGIWAVPLSHITSVLPVKGKATISTWNKEEKITAQKYRRLVTLYKGTYYLKSRYSVQFTHNGDEWEILIPAYDIEVVTELTGKYPT